MKVKLGISPTPVQACTPVDMVALAAEINDLKDKICSVTGEIAELSQVVDNLQLVRHAVAESEKPMDALTTLDTVASVESLLGVAADKITKSAAMEGLGSAIKSAFDKIVDLIKRFCAWVKSLFSKSADATKATAEQAVEASKEVKDAVEASKKPEPQTSTSGQPKQQTTPKPAAKTIEASDLLEWGRLLAYLDGLIQDVVKLNVLFAPYSNVAQDFDKKNPDELYNELVKKVQDAAVKSGVPGIKAGAPNSGILPGMIALNDQSEFFPAKKSGTPEQLNWKPSAIDNQITQINKLKAIADKLGNCADEQERIFKNMLKKAEAADGVSDSSKQQMIQYLTKMVSASKIYTRAIQSAAYLEKTALSLYKRECVRVKSALE